MLYNRYKYDRGKYETADLEEGLSAVTSTVTTTVNAVATYSPSVSVSVTSTSNVYGITYKSASASSSSSSTISCSVKRIRNVEASRTVYSSATAKGAYIVLISASTTATGGLNFNFIRIVTASVPNVSVSSSFTANAREKWVTIPEPSEIWTVIAA